MNASSQALAKCIVEFATQPSRISQIKVHVKVSRTYSCLQTNRRRWTSNIPLELLVDSCIFSPSLMHQQGSGFLIGQTKWMSKLVQSKAVLLKPIKNLKAKAHTRYKREAAKLSFQI